MGRTNNEFEITVHTDETMVLTKEENKILTTEEKLIIWGLLGKAVNISQKEILQDERDKQLRIPTIEKTKNCILPAGIIAGTEE